MSSLHSHHLDALHHGVLGVSELASRVGVSEEAVEHALHGYRLGLERSARLRRRVVRVVQVAAALVLVFLAGQAASQAGCLAPQGWNPLLRVMCIDQPALAEDVNANFARLHDWLAARTGAVDGGVTLPSPSISGTLTASSIVATGPVSFASLVTFDGGLAVNDVVRAQAFQTTLFRQAPSSVLTADGNASWQPIGLNQTFTLDRPATVEFAYSLAGNLTGSGAPVVFLRGTLTPFGQPGLDLPELRVAVAQVGPLLATPRALRQLAPGQYTIAIEAFPSPGTRLTSDSAQSSQSRTLTVHVLGAAR